MGTLPRPFILKLAPMGFIPATHRKAWRGHGEWRAGAVDQSESSMDHPRSEMGCRNKSGNDREGKAAPALKVAPMVTSPVMTDPGIGARQRPLDGANGMIGGRPAPPCPAARGPAATPLASFNLKLLDCVNQFSAAARRFWQHSSAKTRAFRR